MPVFPSPREIWTICSPFKQHLKVRHLDKNTCTAHKYITQNRKLSKNDLQIIKHFLMKLPAKLPVCDLQIKTGGIYSPL